MTLLIREVREISSGKLSIDQYVPFSFRAYEGVLAGAYYWRVGTKTSLVEMKVQEHSGAVLAVTLPIYKGAVPNCDTSTFDCVPEVVGVPVVDTKEFVGGFYDEALDFRLIRRGNSFFAVLREDAHPEQHLRVDRVGFFVYERELCAIGFFDISSSELEKIALSLQLQ